MSVVKNTTFIQGEPEAIFDLVTTAKYWTMWHPATVGVSGQVEEPMRLGDVIRERARIGGIEAENDWTVTEWERPSRFLLSMPKTRLGDLKIEYRFVARDGGVDFTRELTYDASGFPAEVAEQLAVQMESDSAIATGKIKEMVEEKLATA